MTRHFIILSSAYSIGKRIALDYVYEEGAKDNLTLNKIKEDGRYILEKCGEDTPISKHSIVTSGTSWEDVILADSFFEDVQFINDREEFVDLILKDRELDGLDVARYILSEISCTHLKLEKLTYMCYADYLCETGEKLFNDKIYSYKYGPVIASVYEKYKKNRYGEIYEDDTTSLDETSKRMPIRSRIIASKDGIRKIISINKTLEKYGNLSANELVDITHRANTPWSISGAGEGVDVIIPDDLILKYHLEEDL